MDAPRDGQTHRLGRKAIHTFWDNTLPARLTVAPGDIVVFETTESSRGWIARDVAAKGDPGADPEIVALVAASAYPEPPEEPETELRGHPLTGPIAVTGAEPDDDGP